MPKQEILTSGGAVALAFLASQHHTLHLLVLMFGVGAAGMSFMTMYPAIRRLMLLLSLAIAGVAAYQMVRRNRPLPARIMSGASVIATLWLLVWSVDQFGL